MQTNAAFEGNLSFISLADIFQMLGVNNSSGRLHLTSQYTPDSSVIYFANGNPINATSGKLKGLDAIYALFGWTDGKFQFYQEPVMVDHVVKNSRMDIVLDALRMIDDGEIKKVGPPSYDSLPVELGKKDTLPVIKGPMIDYTYVIDREDFRDEEKIVREKGHGNWIWVVLEGVVKISRDTPKGHLTLARLGEGCFIGNLASFLLLRGHSRSATVTAVGNVQLGVVDTQRLSEEYVGLSSDFRRLLLSLDGRLRKITSIIINLSVKNYKVEELTKNKKLFMKQGSSSAETFFIENGKAVVVRKTPQGNLPLLSLKKGDIFGYIPFLNMDHEPQSAYVLASKDFNVSKIDTAGLQDEYSQLSGAFRNLIDGVVTSIAVTTKLACRLKLK